MTIAHRAKKLRFCAKMESVIYSLSKLKRITNFAYPLDEIGIMVNHSVKVQNQKLDRYFFCFSFNKEKYNTTAENLRPSFAILPPGTLINSSGTAFHDELFFSYTKEQSAKLAQLFSSVGKQKYSTFLQMDDIFKQNLLNIKEMLPLRNTIGIADQLDALAMQMIMTAYANSFQNNTEQNSEPDARIQEIALKLKHGEKLDSLLRKYGFSRRAFYYEWNRNFSVSPKHIQLEMKLEHAQKLLLTTKLSIAEIALQCEFSSHRYFHECFIKYFNSTPGDYRKRFNRQ